MSVTQSLGRPAKAAPRQLSLSSHLDRNRLIDFLAGTVRIRSYSGDEREIAEHMAQEMRARRLDVTLQEVAPKRYNAIGRWRGRGEGGRSVMFNGHMDTNPAGLGWTRDPLGGDVDEAFVYGIGVSNMKSANAAALHAVEMLQEADFEPDADIVLAYVVGELQGGVGTVAMLERGVRTDCFIVGEPTDLDVLTCHAASFVFRISTLGKTRHLSKRDEGIDAIEKMEKVMQRLRRLTFSGARTRRDRSLNRINIGVIRGGVTRDYFDWRPQQLADVCTIKCAGRYGPNQSLDGAMADLQAMLADLGHLDPDFDAELELLDDERIMMPPFEVDARCAMARTVIEANRAVTGHRPRVGAVGPTRFFGSDAAHLSRAGMEGVVCGPGGRYNTMPDERVDIPDIIAAAEIYARVMAQTASKDKMHVI